MTATTLKQGSSKELKRLFAMLTGTIGESLGALVGREVVVRGSDPEMMDVESYLARIPRACAVARGSLDKDFAGKFFCSLIEVPDAIALAGFLMMTPDDIIAQNRNKGVLEGEDAEAFGELGNLLYSGFGNVLREQLGNIDIRMHDHGVVKPSLDANGILGTGQVVIAAFRMKVGDLPESGGCLCIDRETAEKWNKAPLEIDSAEAATAAAATGTAAAPTAPRGLEDDGLESIPAAPIQGTLAAFVMQPEIFRTLRRSCRRVGFELRRHGRGEIPNPAAHRNETVLIDVPAGEDRRFDWCRRIKELSATTKVVLLIHHPSRQRVTQGFLSNADVIVGLPCDELQLSHKLGALLASGPESPQE